MYTYIFMYTYIAYIFDYILFFFVFVPLSCDHMCNSNEHLLSCVIGPRHQFTICQWGKLEGLEPYLFVCKYECVRASFASQINKHI